MSAPIHYSVRIGDVGAHTFQVQCTIQNPDPLGQIFSLPTWIPGSYLIRDFAKHVVKLTAENAAGELLVTPLDKTTWQTEPSNTPVTLQYTIYAFDLSVRTAWLDTERGFFNGTSLFMRVHGAEALSHAVTLVQPEDHRLVGWRVATSMPRLTGQRFEYGQFACDDYWQVIDHPFELGDFQYRSFSVAGVEHIVVVAGHQRGDLDRLTADVQTICAAHVERWGEIPMREYWFLLAVVGQGYGGLEHMDSTALLASRDDLPLPNMRTIGKKYRTLLGLFSHEYFHCWNVKRIQPEAFVQGNTTTECYTELLWAFEGITSYYDDYTLLTSGVLQPQVYLDCVAESASRVYQHNGRHQQSLVASSFAAWTKFYQQDENAPNAIVSYYGKGALVALALDLLLRRDAGLTLDQVLHALWQQHGQPRLPVPETAIEAIVVDMVPADLQASFVAFFDCALRGTNDYPLPDLLADFAVRWQQITSGLASLRLSAKVQQGRLLVAQTYTHGAAQQAGLAVGDELLALNGVRLRSTDWQQQVAAYAVGEQVVLQVFRQDVLLTLPVTLQASGAGKVNMQLMSQASAEALARRRAWLGS